MKHYGNWNVSGEVTSNSAETKTLTIGETIYVSTKVEWDLLFNDTSGGEYYKQLSSDYDGKNITIFLSSTPTDESFFETNKIILLETSNQTGKGIGKANLIGSGSADYQFLNCTIKGDVSNCNFLFNEEITCGGYFKGDVEQPIVPTPVLNGKVKDCQLCFSRNESATKYLLIGSNGYNDENAILYKCNYGYNIQIIIKNCIMYCRYISSSTDLTNIRIDADDKTIYSESEEIVDDRKPNYVKSNVYCFYSVNSINNLRFQDSIISPNHWSLGQIWNLSNSYISSNVLFNDKLKYVSSTDFASMSLVGASEENKIDFDSCICGGYPSWYWSHKTLQTSINAINKNREDEYYSKYFTSPFSFSVFRYRDIRMISIPNQNVSSLASTTGKIDLGANFGIADSKTYYFSGFLGGYKISISIENVSMYTTLNYSISSNTYTADTINSGLSIIIPCSIS